ncbi:MAG: hypothetical protein AB1760_12585 [Pseudomonadota bacterium]
MSSPDPTPETPPEGPAGPRKPNLGQIAMGAALALVAGPIAAFKAMEIIFYMASVAPGDWIGGAEPTALPVSVVVLIFAGLTAAYGVRMILREVRGPRP